MHNRLHEVLGGRVRCRRVRHTRTICSFPGYCLGLRMRQKVFFRCLTPFYPIYWPYFCLNVEICRFLCWQTTDNRRQTNRLLYPLLALRMRARGVKRPSSQKTDAYRPLPSLSRYSNASLHHLTKMVNIMFPEAPITIYGRVHTIPESWMKILSWSPEQTLIHIGIQKHWLCGI